MVVAGHSDIGGTRLQILVAGILALGGGAAMLYAGFLPIPPFSTVPVPLAWQLLGVAGLAAGFGVFRGQASGRALGIGVATIDLTLVAFRAAASGLPNTLGNVAFSGVLDVVVLWVLVRRWPARPLSSASRATNGRPPD